MLRCARCLNVATGFTTIFGGSLLTILLLLVLSLSRRCLGQVAALFAPSTPLLIVVVVLLLKKLGVLLLLASFAVVLRVHR